MNTIYYSVFLPLGVAGNLLCIVVVGYIVRYQASRRSVPDILVGFLSAVELFSILSFHCVAVTAMAVGQWVFPQTVCTVQAISVGFYLKLEFLVQVCIYVDRYLALTKPFRYQQCSSIRLVRVVIIVIICISIVTSTLMVVTSYPGVRLLSTWYLCVYQLDNSIAPNCVLGMAYLLFSIGFIVVIFCNLHLVRNLCRYHGLGSSNILIQDLTGAIQTKDKDSKIPPQALLELANCVVMSQRHTSSGDRMSTARSSSIRYGATLSPDVDTANSREKSPQFLEIPHQKPRACSVNATTDVENVVIFHHLNAGKNHASVSEGCLLVPKKSADSNISGRQTCTANPGLLDKIGPFRSSCPTRHSKAIDDLPSDGANGIVITVDEPSTSDPQLDSTKTQSTEILRRSELEDSDLCPNIHINPPRILLNDDLRRSQSLATLSVGTSSSNSVVLARRESCRSTCSVKGKRNSILSKSFSVDDGLNQCRTSGDYVTCSLECPTTSHFVYDNHRVSIGRPNSPLVRESYVQRQVSKVLRLVSKALRRQKREIVLARIVLLNACVFVLTWLPFIVSTTILIHVLSPHL